MKAIQLSKHGGPELLTIADWDDVISYHKIGRNYLQNQPDNFDIFVTVML